MWSFDPKLKLGLGKSYNRGSNHRFFHVGIGTVDGEVADDEDGEKPSAFDEL